MDFSKNLEYLQDKLGLSTAGLEKKLGLGNGYIAGLLSGGEKGIKNPGKLLVALVKHNISTDWFLTGEGEMFLEGQNAVENSEQYDEKTARIAELEEKIKALENQEARVKFLEAENKELEAENKQLSEDLLEMVRKFVIAPKAAKA
jgi:hypothetical protein